MGKTGLHELAYGITSDNPHFGTVRNPHDPSAHSRRIERRLGRGGRGGPGFLRDGHRHRRIDPRAGVLLRMRRAETDLRTREPRRCVSARLLSGSCGPADAHGARCRARDERHRGTAASGNSVPPDRRSARTSSMSGSRPPSKPRSTGAADAPKRSVAVWFPSPCPIRRRSIPSAE